MDLKYLIEALRGGGESRFKDGVEVEHSYGAPKDLSSFRQPPMDQRRRGYQLYMNEARVNGETPKSYTEWLSSF